VARALQEETFLSPDTRREILGLSRRITSRVAPGRVHEWNGLILPLLAGMTFVSPTERIRLCRDPDDDAYLSLAKAARAEHLITGDKDLLDIDPAALDRAGLARLRILTPARFISEIR
jgi:predicted nucleic acid-binding protein